MKLLIARVLIPVILLTLMCTSMLSGCANIHQYYSEPCNSHAYSRTILSDFLSNRFHSNSPVRLAVIPFSAPANISGFSSERPGLGNELAWKVRAELLASGQVPIVEILNRQDWPGKKEEFFMGNFGAIAVAREAGYDLVLVGHIHTPEALDRLKASTKLIEVESGITVWYGDTEVKTYAPELQSARAALWLDERRPAMLYLPRMVNRLSQCIVQAITSEEAQS